MSHETANLTLANTISFKKLIFSKSFFYPKLSLTKFNRGKWINLVQSIKSSRKVFIATIKMFYMLKFFVFQRLIQEIKNKKILFFIIIKKFFIFLNFLYFNDKSRTFKNFKNSNSKKSLFHGHSIKKFNVSA